MEGGERVKKMEEGMGIKQTEELFDLFPFGD